MGEKIAKYLVEDLLSSRTLFAAAFYGAGVFLLVTGKELPEALTGIIGTLMGYYFGSRQLKNGNGAPQSPTS